MRACVRADDAACPAVSASGCGPLGGAVPVGVLARVLSCLRAYARVGAAAPATRRRRGSDQGSHVACTVLSLAGPGDDGQPLVHMHTNAWTHNTRTRAPSEGCSTATLRAHGSAGYLGKRRDHTCLHPVSRSVPIEYTHVRAPTHTSTQARTHTHTYLKPAKCASGLPMRRYS